MRIRLAAPAAAALAALALTACQDGSGTKDEGASTPAAATVASSGQKQAEEATTDSGTSAGADSESGTTATTTKTTGSKASGSKKAKSPGRVLCNGSNTKVTAQVLQRPLNHLLLTVKNTGGKTCDLTYFPYVRFDEMQWAPPADKNTQPQAVTTLAPGESGYAGVRLSAADGSGSGGTTGKKLTVMFQGMTPNSDGGASATPKLPSKGVYYDSSLTVTWWQRDLDDVLSW
ncbi:MULTISPECIES: DUF4232 domain-containing protein [unclassified Streptomyces]|uniref:DUF4232 domain-containing protein n=1 Tax=unclassified Streptomyces TaxID=2593676 RepID=UPI00382369DB